MNEDFKAKIIEFVSSLGDEPEYCCCDDGYSHKPLYDKREFISLIMSKGGSIYKPSFLDFDEDTIFETVAEKLQEAFYDAPYFSVRSQNNRIAIATPMYIKNAPEAIASELRIVPEIFIEVSGPMSTVLIIDCEKEFLKKAYLGIGEDEWLI